MGTSCICVMKWRSGCYGTWWLLNKVCGDSRIPTKNQLTWWHSFVVQKLILRIHGLDNTLFVLFLIFGLNLIQHFHKNCFKQVPMFLYLSQLIVRLCSCGDDPSPISFQLCTNWLGGVGLCRVDQNFNRHSCPLLPSLQIQLLDQLRSLSLS